MQKIKIMQKFNFMQKTIEFPAPNSFFFVSMRCCVSPKGCWKIWKSWKNHGNLLTFYGTSWKCMESLWKNMEFYGNYIEKTWNFIEKTLNIIQDSSFILLYSALFWRFFRRIIFQCNIVSKLNFITCQQIPAISNEGHTGLL